ncbi:hypothetical protein ES703_114143 [subsurface metagenome]
MEKNIWINGPIELLNHGIIHLTENKGFDLRIAMISIDNAVETTIKSYLSLNRRSLGIDHEVLNKSTRNFPKMLNLLLSNCSDKISSEELDAIEMFHKIRNSLYHQGTGITVEKEIVERYAIVAKDLISRLFEVEERIDFELETVSDITKLYGEFLMIWRDIEVNLKNYALISEIIPQTPRPLTIVNIINSLVRNELIDGYLAYKISNIRHFRNNIIHSQKNYTIDNMNELIAQIKEIKEEVLTLINL